MWKKGSQLNAFVVSIEKNMYSVMLIVCSMLMTNVILYTIFSASFHRLFSLTSHFYFVNLHVSSNFMKWYASNTYDVYNVHETLYMTASTHTYAVCTCDCMCLYWTEVCARKNRKTKKKKKKKKNQFARNWHTTWRWHQTCSTQPSRTCSDKFASISLFLFLVVAIANNFKECYKTMCELSISLSNYFALLWTVREKVWIHLQLKCSSVVAFFCFVNCVGWVPFSQFVAVVVFIFFFFFLIFMPVENPVIACVYCTYTGTESTFAFSFSSVHLSILKEKRRQTTITTTTKYLFLGTYVLMAWLQTTR